MLAESRTQPDRFCPYAKAGGSFLSDHRAVDPPATNPNQSGVTIMATTTTLKNAAATFDQAARRFLDTDFHRLPESQSEAFSAGDFTIMAHRDILRPDLYWCVSILCRGNLVTSAVTVADDLSIHLTSAIDLIRSPAIELMERSSLVLGFANLE